MGPKVLQLRLDDLALPRLVHPPMTVMAFLLTAAVATCDLAGDSDVMFLHVIVVIRAWGLYVYLICMPDSPRATYIQGKAQMPRIATNM